MNFSRLLFTYSTKNSSYKRKQQDIAAQTRKLFRTFALEKSNDSSFASEQFKEEFSPSIDNMGKIYPEGYLVVRYQPGDRDPKKSYALARVDRKSPKGYSVTYLPWVEIPQGKYLYRPDFTTYLFSENEIVIRRGESAEIADKVILTNTATRGNLSKGKWTHANKYMKSFGETDFRHPRLLKYINDVLYFVSYDWTLCAVLTDEDNALLGFDTEVDGYFIFQEAKTSDVGRYFSVYYYLKEVSHRMEDQILDHMILFSTTPGEAYLWFDYQIHKVYMEKDDSIVKRLQETYYYRTYRTYPLVYPHKIKLPILTENKEPDEEYYGMTTFLTQTQYLGFRVCFDQEDNSRAILVYNIGLFRDFIREKLVKQTYIDTHYLQDIVIERNSIEPVLDPLQRICALQFPHADRPSAIDSGELIRNHSYQTSMDLILLVESYYVHIVYCLKSVRKDSVATCAFLMVNKRLCAGDEEIYGYWLEEKERERHGLMIYGWRLADYYVF